MSLHVFITVTIQRRWFLNFLHLSNFSEMLKLGMEIIAAKTCTKDTFIEGLIMFLFPNVPKNP